MARGWYMFMFRFGMRELLVLSFFLGSGCVSSTGPWGKIPNPFDAADDADPLYADTKAAKIDQIHKRAKKVESMGSMERAQVATEFSKRLRDESDPIIKLELVRALEKFTNREAFAGLKTALNDSRPRIRQEACRTLGKMNTSESVALLTAVVRGDSNLDVRHEATRSLGNFQGSNDALQALSIAIEDPDVGMQLLAVESMRRVHDEDLGKSLAAWRQLARRIRPVDADISVAESNHNVTR